VNDLAHASWLGASRPRLVDVVEEVGVGVAEDEDEPCTFHRP
jgi:hypothetical protein